jgi:hypothetical protein
MDFIEKLFGVSPDGGDGVFEFLLFLIPLAIVFALRFALRSGTGRASRRY